jgi:hypothetical protein
MALEFKKDDETCSNVYLIDERLCLEKSFEIINTNVVTLSSNLNNLQTYCNDYNILYTNFSNNSARWIRAISNFQTLSAGWFSAETTVKTLSSYWYTDLNIIYKTIIDYDTYYADQNFYQNSIRDWLITNFMSNIVNNQIINVDLYISRPEPFTWIFYRSYYEGCIPQNQVKPSAGCGCPKPSYNCNHVRVGGSLQNNGSCMNAASFCGFKNATVIGSANVNCPNNANPSHDVILNHVDNSFDKALTRVISLKYKRVDNTIIKI